MARIVRVKNTLADTAQKTFISTAVVAAGTSIPVQNISAFEQSWAVQIGGTGEEKTEIKLISAAAPSGTALNLAAGLTFSHPSDTPVYAIKYDQVVFKKSTSGTTGTANIIASGTVNIQADSDTTQFDDPTSGTADAYKAFYQNSVLGDSTDDSSFITTTGFSFYSLAKMRTRARRKLFDSKFIKDDAVIDDWMNEWLELMTNTAIDVNRDYLLGTTDVAHGTNGLATVAASDFKEVRKIWYTTNGTDFFNAVRINSVDFLPDQTFNETAPFYYPYGDNIFGKKPEGSSGTARIDYYKRPSVLRADSDEIPESMRSYTKTFVDYVRAQAAYLDGKKEDGDRFLVVANEGRDLFKEQIAPRWKSGPQYIDLVAPLDGDDDDNQVFARAATS